MAMLSRTFTTSLSSSVADVSLLRPSSSSYAFRPLSPSSSSDLLRSGITKSAAILKRRNLKVFTVRASSEDDDCNAEECAPEKEVGQLSVEWLAEEKTKVVGTYPPRTRRGWTGYVEKDTAGQTNIYSVEPAVYVAESAISSGTAGSSADGAENTVALAAGLALIFVAACSSVLFLVGKNSPPVQIVEYNGPSLSYYINKFKATGIVESSLPSQTEPSTSAQLEGSAPEVAQVQLQAEYQQEPSTSSASSVS